MKNLILSCLLLSTITSSAQLLEYRERQNQMSAEEVLAWLKAGNERFSTGLSTNGGFFRDARNRVQVSSQGQRPIAAVLSCIDSRTTPEIVFDTSVGDLFTTRVGGNTISHEVLGSLEVSVASGVKVIVVLGHKNCGAVIAACRDVEFEHLTRIINKVKPAIATTNDMLDQNPKLSAQVGERTPENMKYIAHVSHSNAKQSARQILEQSSFLRERKERGEIILLSALYDVSTGNVEFDDNL